MSSVLRMLAHVATITTAPRAKVANKAKRKSFQRVRVTVLWDELQSLLERFDTLNPEERDRCEKLSHSMSILRRPVKPEGRPHEHREVLGAIEGEQSAEEFAIRYSARLHPSYDRWSVSVRFRSDDSLEFASVGHAGENEDTEAYSIHVTGMMPTPRESRLRSEVDATELRKPRVRYRWVAGLQPTRDLSEFRSCNRVRWASYTLHLGKLRTVLATGPDTPDNRPTTGTPWEYRAFQPLPTTRDLFRWSAGKQTAEYATTKRILATVGTKVLAERKRVKALTAAGKVKRVPAMDAKGNYLLTGRMLTLTLRRATRLLQGKRK